MNNSIHTPLFYSQILDVFKKNQVNRVIDATFAEGGHGLGYAKQQFSVLGIEWDKDMYKLGMDRIKNSGLTNIKLVNGNYKDIAKLAAQMQFAPVDAIIFDLGLSMYQLDKSTKGFSSNREANLDLRIGADLELTASGFLNTAGKQEIVDVITRYVEDKTSLNIAREIFKYRLNQPINKISDLRTIIKKTASTDKQVNKLLRQVLQALRIIVNDEPNNIRQGFLGALSILKKGGLIVVLTYHSQEDRLIKLLSHELSRSIKPIDKVIKNKDYQFAKSGKLRIFKKYGIY